MAYSLIPDVYVHPTPGGCYHAVSSAAKSPERATIRALLNQNKSVIPTLDMLKSWSSLTDEQQVLGLWHRLQTLQWVEGLQEPKHCAQQSLETILPQLLSNLGSQGKALLADNQGFYLASSGFPHEVAEELSALSADLANLHERRAGLLQHNMSLRSSAFAVVDAAGNSQLGFWPLYIGPTRFVLVVSGMPHLNHPDFVALTWLLTRRYS